MLDIRIEYQKMLVSAPFGTLPAFLPLFLPFVKFLLTPVLWNMHRLCFKNMYNNNKIRTDHRLLRLKSVPFFVHPARKCAAGCFGLSGPGFFEVSGIVHGKTEKGAMP